MFIIVEGTDYKPDVAYAEEWVIIPDFPKYIVSNYGRVYNIEKEFILVKSLAGYRYSSVRLQNETGSYHKRICRLVATAFIPNPNMLATVNHKDEDKLNDFVHNLEWLSNVDNIRYSQATRVVQLDPMTLKVVMLHPSINASGVALGDPEKHKNIYKVCLRERSQAYGYFWFFEDDYLDLSASEIAALKYTPANTRKAVLQMDKDTGVLLDEFESITAAAKAIGKRTGGISSCLIGSANTAYGYIWKYKGVEV